MMIKEQAKVIAIESGNVTVECVTKSACSACASKSSCSSGVVSAAYGEKTQRFSFQQDEKQGLSLGDSVDIGIAEQSLLKGAFLVYVLPLLCFIAAALVADKLVEGPEWLTIVSAFVSGLVGYLLSRYFLQRNKGKLQPILLDKNQS